MPSQRKPRGIRLAQTQNLVSQYKDAGLSSHRNYSFISQMESKLKAKRNISKKQRDWLDSLIDAGIPVCKNKDLCVRIMTAIGVSELEFHRPVLESFYKQAYDGKTFSEKQNAYLESLLSKANDFIRGNFWKPSRDQYEDAKICLKLAKDFDHLWVASHPGFAIAWREVQELTDGKRRSISERRFLQFMKWTSKKLRDYKNPRFCAGQMAWINKHDAARIAQVPLRDEDPTSLRILITSDVYINDKGQTVNDVLIGGSLVTLRQESIKKRR